MSVARKAVLPLFLVSGAAGLIYEITWTRIFGDVFGNTVFAVSTVLTAFMLGLALGGWFFGRIADRTALPLKLYALLELAIGIYALILPTFLSATDVFYRWFLQHFHPGFYPLSLVRFVLSVVILLFPTILMGGTLPILSCLWENRSSGESGKPRTGQSVGLLYAINTFGAVAGCFLSGYVLIRLFGVSHTVYLAAGANIVVGLTAMGLSRLSTEPIRHEHKRRARRSRSKPMQVTDPPDQRQRLVLMAVGLAGFCALALEVLWTRTLLFVLETSVYAFTSMLTCFILGIALGSFVCSRLPLGKIKKPIFYLGVVEFLIGVSVLLSIVLLGRIGMIDYYIINKWGMRGLWQEAGLHFLDASIILLPPTILMGAAFPLAVEIGTRSSKGIGTRVGDIYASNTVGCTIGSFVAGFILIPLFGLRGGFLTILAIQFFLAAAVIFFSEVRRTTCGISAIAISATVLLMGLLLIPQDVFLQTINTYHHPSKIVYIKDDATGTVTVHDLPDGDRLIAVDGVDVAGMDLMLRTTQMLQAYAPLIVHSNPQKVLQIGFGSGETCGIGLAFGVEQYSIAEICPGVFEAGKFFEDINRGSYKNPRLRKIIMDGKNFVKLTDEKFDIIMNDSTYPGTTGSSALYTYDHFSQCRERLTDEGVLSCWVPLDLRLEDFAIIVRSFQAAMPYSSLWMVNNCLNKHAVLMGTMLPTHIDFQRVKELVERPNVAADLLQINIHSVYEFLDCFVVGQEGLRTIGANGPLNTDDKPFLEFGAAIKRDIEGCWLDVLTSIRRNHSPVSRYVVNMGRTEQDKQPVRERLEQYFKGTGYALHGMLAILQGDPDIMNRQFDQAQKANPLDRDVGSCLNELMRETTALTKAIERTPEKAILRSRLAKRYLLLQDYERAVEHYSAFVKLEPGNAAGWNNLGICHSRLEQFEKAIRAFQIAIDLDTPLTVAYLNLADAHEKRGDWDAASSILEKAVSICPDAERIRICDTLARSYFMQKKYDLALEILEKALEFVSNDTQQHDYLESRKEFVKRAAKEARENN
ncbi:MAG: fused MFS/spermidine synthase [Sedimentisphaerales bacterium]|nr:fused MFS/spermidine synthase [Sedimentisphaerales bacterium]